MKLFDAKRMTAKRCALCALRFAITVDGLGGGRYNLKNIKQLKGLCPLLFSFMPLIFFVVQSGLGYITPFER